MISLFRLYKSNRYTVKLLLSELTGTSFYRALSLATFPVPGHLLVLAGVHDLCNSVFSMQVFNSLYLLPSLDVSFC